jgi:hypothetical protein
MRTALAALILGLVTLPALAGPAAAPAPAPKATAPVGPGALFVESEEGAATKLVISGSFRTVWDNTWNLNDFNSESGRSHQEYLDSRLELGFLFQLQEGVEVFVQPQVNYVWGGRQIGTDSGGDTSASSAGNDNLRIYQAWVALHPELFGLNPVIKVGRMELAFGSEMILGNNTRYGGQSFDAVRLDVKPLPGLTTTLFGAKVVENDQDYVNGLSTGSDKHKTQSDAYLCGLWNTLVLDGLDTSIDLYGLLFQAQDGIQDTTTILSDYNGVPLTKQELYTLGARVKVTPIELAPKHAFDLDFSAEVAVQLGTVYEDNTNDEHNVEAYAFETEFGMTFGAIPWTPRLAVGLALASGDRNPGDQTERTFRPLFQDTTDRLGDADLVSLSNLTCWFVKASVKPLEKLEVGTAYYRFEAMQTESDVGGGNYTQLNNGLTPGAGVDNDDNDLGDELDIYADIKLTKNVSLRGVFAWINPEDFLIDSGKGNSPGSRLFAVLAVKW